MNQRKERLGRMILSLKPSVKNKLMTVKIRLSIVMTWIREYRSETFLEKICQPAKPKPAKTDNNK